MTIVVLRSSAQTQPLAKASDVLLLSESEQIEFIHSDVNGLRGEATTPDAGDAMHLLIYRRTQITLPVLEQEAEAELRFEAQGQTHSSQVCRSSLALCLGFMIAGAGDRYALVEIQKLLHLDKQKFSGLVTQTLNCAHKDNPFALAYEALAINDPLIDPGVMDWIQPRIANEETRPSYEKMWAEAMAERFKFAPTASEIARDPIASRLDRTLYTSMEPHLIRLSAEAALRRKPQL